MGEITVAALTLAPAGLGGGGSDALAVAHAGIGGGGSDALAVLRGNGLGGDGCRMPWHEVAVGGGRGGGIVTNAVTPGDGGG